MDFSDFVQRVRAGYSSNPWFQDRPNTKRLTLKNRLWWCGDSIAVPDVGNLRKEVLNELHDAPYSGHYGFHKTLKSISTLYWWPDLRQDVWNHVRNCDVCQRDKVSHQKPVGLLQPLEILDRKWECVSMDFITGLTPSKKGNDAILVVVDKLSKMAHFIPTTTEVSAEDTSHLFHENVVKLHEIPNKIISDRDPRFTSRFWSEVSQMMGTRQAMSTANHPQTDGQTERVNQDLEDMLQHYVGPTQEDWDEHLASAEFAYNNAWHESIKNTPFMLNYGQHPLTPMYRGISRDRVPAARAFVGAMSEMLAEAKEHLKAAQQRQKAHADKKRREVSYDIGDQLLLSTKNIKLKTPGARKLLPKWIGPFRVVKRIGEVAYKVELPDTMQMHDVFHVSLLKPYRSDGTIQPPPSPLFIDNELMFKVDRVLMHRERKSGKKVI